AMSEEVLRQFEQLPANLANHLLVTILPLFLGVFISLPLAVLAVRDKRLRYPIMTVVSVIQTIPSLALLALMVPFLVLVNTALAGLGVQVSELGFYPTVIALTLYSILPILRNTVTGILDVDPVMKQAARGVGMTPFQSLMKVELPLAMPVIVAGIRTATVWTVGIATLATPVGQRCLGNYIFEGLHTRNWVAVLFGCVSAAILAVLLDMLVGLLQTATEERRPKLGIIAGSILTALFLGGLVSPTIVRFLSRPDTPILASGEKQDEGPAIRKVVVGSKSFTEQYILADLITNRLKEAGFEVQEKESLGSTVIFDALSNGEVDCYVDYSGTIWANYMKRDDVPPSWRVLAEMQHWLASEHNIRSLGTLGFENAYALAMRRDQAEKLGIRTISDLAHHAGSLRLGGDLEFFNRPEWRDLKAAYGLSFAEKTSFAATFMYEAIQQDEVDVVSAFTTDGRIAAYELLVLEDDRGAIPPYDALILLSPRVADSKRLTETLEPLVDGIDADTMRQANFRVDRESDKKTVGQAAEWLSQRLPD
ncbi:MAG: ABC transporter permease subunit, partial [Planctomycetaceae bacterium]|nr:ABC transporter permease subunit [Planctomycetaceae bacterium]